MEPAHDPDLAARVFDEYGEQEWERHDASPAARVSFQIHRTYLARFINQGDHVLDAGAGPGRFTLELARLGAVVTALDVSPQQLRLNRQHLEEVSMQAAVVAWEVGDIVDLSRFPDGSFDATVCYGGPLSYVLDRAPDALHEMLRVTKIGGRLLFSVMSLVGTMRAFLPGVDEEMHEFGLETMRRIFDTGDLPLPHSSTGPLHMFRWEELRALIDAEPCRIVAASASNFLSLQNDEVAGRWLDDTDASQALLDWELRACADPAAIGAGTHILVVVERCTRAGSAGS